MRDASTSRQLKTAAAVLVLVVYLHVLMEWLFFATKHSFLSSLGVFEKISVLLVTPLPIAAGGLVLLAASALLALPVAAAGRRLRSVVRVLLAWVPGAALAAAAFLWIDNFTYTLFGFGSISQRGAGRVVYQALLWGLVLLAVLWVLETLAKPGHRRPRAAAVLAGVSCLALLPVPLRRGYEVAEVAAATTGKRLPDILLLSADGLEARALGVYGGEAGRTPFLDAFSRDAAVLENAFTNADRTAGSVALVLTGRHAATTHKLNDAHQFTAGDAYRHLPAILKRLGYRSLQVGPRVHVDARAWNLRDAFDFHNRRRVGKDPLERLSELAGGRLDWEMRFVRILAERLRGRLLHVFGLELLQRPAHLDVDADPRSRLDVARDFLRERPQDEAPIFLQAHFIVMGPQQAPIFDGYLESLLRLQEARGADRDTVVVIWSDHGVGHGIYQRLPLIVKLPAGLRVPDLAANAQNLDVAPTLLDALGVGVPEWMEGTSLLGRRDPRREIVILQADGQTRGLALGGVTQGGPQALTTVVCQRAHTLSFADGSLTTRTIEGHTAPCAEDELPAADEVRRRLLRHLAARGYDLSSVPAPEGSS